VNFTILRFTKTCSVLQIDPESMEAFASPRCATMDGFSLHAMSGCKCKPDRAQPSIDASVPAGDRPRLEHLARQL